MTKRQLVLVQVTFGDGMYTAECDELHLVTEAPTFEALTKRVWDLLPDIIEANGLARDPDCMRLQFEFAQDRPKRRSFAEVLAAMPNVGVAADFARAPDSDDSANVGPTPLL